MKTELTTTGEPGAATGRNIARLITQLPRLSCVFENSIRKTLKCNERMNNTSPTLGRELCTRQRHTQDEGQLQQTEAAPSTGSTQNARGPDGECA